MSFYEALTPFYDRIFPLNQNALSFISDYFQKEESLLDIGSGTGNMAVALAEMGLEVTALEPEETMAELIREKSSSKGLSITVSTEPMERMDKFQKSYDGLICIGNTIAHLHNLEEVESFLSKCYTKLKQNGRLILQAVNYDHVLSNDDFSFPVVTKEDFTFTRLYEKQGDKILFTTILKADEESIKNTVSLFPITSKQLVPLLNKAGFQTVNLYGNYKHGEYTSDSPALIVVAKK